MQILKVINHKWADVMSHNKVKLLRCTCCSTSRYMVTRGNMPLISTFYKENALAIYFYEKNKRDDEDVL